MGLLGGVPAIAGRVASLINQADMTRPRLVFGEVQHIVPSLGRLICIPKDEFGLYLHLPLDSY